MSEILPATVQNQGAAADHILIEPMVELPDGSVYVHHDLQQRVEPWAVEGHIAPPKVTERFGDVASWAAYVKAYSGGTLAGAGLETFITWGSRGLKAVLDYHTTTPGRCQWVAEHPFVIAPEWAAWTGLATGHAVPQKTAVELLEEHYADIQEPDPATLLNLLRNLRGNIAASAEVKMRPDGTSEVQFSRNSTIAAAGVELPELLVISVPIFRGHTNAEGEKVVYRFDVRLRADVHDSHLALRFTILSAEAALEEALAELILQAQAELGDGYTLYRAAD